MPKTTAERRPALTQARVRPPGCSSGVEVCAMLAAVKGIVQGNTVVIEDDDIRDYDGTEVIVTLFNYPQK